MLKHNINQQLVLPRSFYARDTVTVARDLLGKYLRNQTSEGWVAGMIVETEAYLQNDPACHASKGMTRRNRIMFGPPGYAYVYFIYGVHYCFNVVTASEGVGEAVLIRALEPVEGISLMKERRGGKGKRELCKGPGSLTKAMGINGEHNGVDLTLGSLAILEGNYYSTEVVTTSRVGINQGVDLPLRFYLKGNEYVSKRKGEGK